MDYSALAAKILRTLADAIENGEPGKDGAVGVLIMTDEGLKLFLPVETTAEEVDELLELDPEIIMLAPDDYEYPEEPEEVTPEEEKKKMN
jgi:hypothetical protein